MSVQSYPIHFKLFQFISVCLCSFTNRTAWSARFQKNLTCSQSHARKEIVFSAGSISILSQISREKNRLLQFWSSHHKFGIKRCACLSRSQQAQIYWQTSPWSLRGSKTHIVAKPPRYITWFSQLTFPLAEFPQNTAIKTARFTRSQQNFISFWRTRNRGVTAKSMSTNCFLVVYHGVFLFSVWT